MQPQSREKATKEKLNGALVQLVRIHACHAWGHGFESRTHREKKSWFILNQDFLFHISGKIKRREHAVLGGQRKNLRDLLFRHKF